MNTTEIEDHLEELNKRARKIGNRLPGSALITHGPGSWSVMVEHPKLFGHGATAERAFAEADIEMARHEQAAIDLARTLGLEVA